MVDRLHLFHPREGAARRLRGPAAVVGERQGHRAGAAATVGPEQSGGMSVELVDSEKQLPIAYRNTIANMMAEGEAQNGIFAPDDITYAWYRDKGIAALPYPPFQPGADAVYDIDETLDLSGVQPMIAPFSPVILFPLKKWRGADYLRQGDDRAAPTAATTICSRRHSSSVRRGSRAMHAARGWSSFRVGGVGRQIKAGLAAGRRVDSRSSDRWRQVRQSWCGRVSVDRRTAEGPARDHVVQPQLQTAWAGRRRVLASPPSSQRRRSSAAWRRRAARSEMESRRVRGVAPP